MLAKEEMDALALAFREHLKKSFDDRDTALLEKIAKQHEEAFGKYKAEIERKYASRHLPGLDVDSQEIKNFSMARLVHGLARGNVARYAPHEFELCTAALNGMDEEDLTSTQKDMIAGTDTAGGFLVPVQVMESQIIPILQATVIAFQAGVMRMPGLSGSPVVIPKITGAVTGGLNSGLNVQGVEETEAPTKDDLTLGQISMFPHDAFATTTLSNRLIAMSMPGADQLVRQQLVRDVALKVDNWIFNGLGSASEPRGIFQATGINTVGSFGDITAGAAYNNLIDMEGTVIESNALSIGGEPCFVLHPALFRKMRKMKDVIQDGGTSGAVPIEQFARRLLDGPAPKSIIGYPYYRSTLLPTDKFLFGVFSSVILGEWGSMILAASNVAGNNFINRTTQILCGLTVDTAFRFPKAICAATGVT